MMANFEGYFFASLRVMTRKGSNCTTLSPCAFSACSVGYAYGSVDWQVVSFLCCSEQRRLLGC